MSITTMEVRFHLTGGQTVSVLMPAAEGQSFDADDFKTVAKEWREASNLWLSQKTDWALSIPDMKNVAMIEFVPA